MDRGEMFFILYAVFLTPLISDGFLLLALSFASLSIGVLLYTVRIKNDQKLLRRLKKDEENKRSYYKRKW